ncbi:MAG: NAD(P)H-dependent oxidoreductase subunit E [Anaerolineales bacterium]|jgi:NADH:ubiquinone oxidoreductase subunit E|nr:NAD(P)H-dependent oxidoreductase subunit E [Anaerolineales bacterium]
MKSSSTKAAMPGAQELTDGPVKLSVAQAIARHGKARDALIPILTEINQTYGHIPAEAYAEIKRQINLPDQAGLARETVFVSESQLFGLATFYEMISTKPVGRHVIRFCESAPCHVMGGRVLFQAVKEKLGLQPGETTPDNRFTLITTSCLGTCGVGPVLLIDEDIYGNVLPEQLNTILARYE